MKAQEALQLTESKIPSLIDKEYEAIIKRIIQASESGETDICFGFSMPNERVVDRLRHDGYRFYSTGDDFMLPCMYSLTWKKEIKKKRTWIERLLFQ